ncbi:MAG: PepSY-like domain-containing protein, partial [Bacteroides sp.]|nr:PepSY-like domain-containing protein [Bacteroides sp.]
IVAFQFVKAQDIFTSDVQMLPEKGRSFLSEHFPAVKVSHLKKENEIKDILDKKKYEVTLTDGTKIEFDKDGDWMEIESHGKEVPASVVPDRIRTYLSTHMSGQPVTQIEKSARDIKLS